MKTNNLIACNECDALQREASLEDNGRALCARCGAELYRCKVGSLDQTLAFVLAASVVFIFANTHPLMGLDARGIQTSATLLDTARALWEHDMASVALLVFVTIWAMPVAQLAAMLYMLVPLKLGILPPRIHFAFRIVSGAQRWAMVEVFLLGALVSLVKLTQVAAVEPGVGIYSVGGYVMLLAAAVSSFEPRNLWARVEALGEALPALREGTRA